MREATVKFEHAALRPLFLLNGGRLIAFLAFLGTAAGSNLNAEFVIRALIAWGFGLILACITTALAYFSQLAFYKAQGYDVRLNFGLEEYTAFEELDDAALRSCYQKSSRNGNRLRIGAHLFGLFSLIAFAVGIIFAATGYVAIAQ